MDLKSGYPYWPAASGLIHVYPPLRADIQCEVAVVGGGVTGALVAYRLIEAGISTVLVDKRDFGWGSTSASTALIDYALDLPLADLAKRAGEDHAVQCYRAAWEAVEGIHGLVRDIGTPCGFERKDSLYLASRRRDAKALKQEYECRVRHGFPLEYWDRQRIESHFPFSRPAALLHSDAAQVDPYCLTHGLIERAVTRGLRAFDRTEVTGQVVEGGGGKHRVRLATVDGPTILAGTVVYATGYETEEWLKQRTV